MSVDGLHECQCGRRCELPRDLQHVVVRDGRMIIKRSLLESCFEASEAIYDDGMCRETKDEEECGECGWCKTRDALNLVAKVLEKR